MKFFFNFERVLLATRGCSRTLKTPNSPPLRLGIGYLDEDALQTWNIIPGKACYEQAYSETIGNGFVNFIGNGNNGNASFISKWISECSNFSTSSSQFAAVGFSVLVV